VNSSASWCILISITFLALTLFFSLVYYSLRQISWVKLEETLEERRQIDRVQIIHQRLSSLIYSASTLRLISNLGLLMSTAYYFMSGREDLPAHRAWLPLFEAFLVASTFLLFFSVAIPQAWAKYGSTAVLVRCYFAIRLADTLFQPVTLLMHGIDDIVRRHAGVSLRDSEEDRIQERQEELLSLGEGQKKEGAVDEQERDMIESVLDFRDTTVDQIMTPRTEVIGINADDDFQKAVDLVMEYGHSRYPVYEQSIDTVIGMLYAKDLLKGLNKNERLPSLRKIIRNAFFVPESKTIRDLLHDFQTQKVHLAVVLDEYGGTAGIVTIEDVVEELVGEIEDEYEEPAEQKFLKIADNIYEVDARCHVDEFNDELEMDLPEDEDYETLAGFAFTRLGAIPKNGDTFEFKNLFFTIIDAEPRKINRLKIEIRPIEQEPDS